LLALVLIGSIALPCLAQSLVVRPPRKGTKYSVVIDSAPQQVAVYLDDKKYGVVGYTPYKGRLVRGKYKLILQRDGYIGQTLEIEVSRSQRKFFAVLQKDTTATIVISAAADKALVGGYVHVDGKYVGKVPLETKVPAGRHQVIIQRKGYKHFSQWVELKASERLQLAPALKRLTAAPGSLLVDAAVPSAEVLINGKKHPDKTPTVIEGLAPGMHAVEVRAGKEGAWTLKWKKLVEVKSGQRVKVRAEAPARPKPVAPAATGKTAAGLPKTPPTSAGVGTIRVLSSVANAHVLLDGKAMGASPADPKRGLDIKFVPVGAHEITVKLADGRVARAKVMVNKDQLVQIALTPLAPKPAAPTAGAPAKTPAGATATKPGPKGRLKVTASVDGAQVKINGKPVGTAPLEIELPVGEHQVLVAAPGTTPFAQGARVAEGLLTTINAQLKKGLPISPMMGKGRDAEHMPIDRSGSKEGGDKATDKPAEKDAGKDSPKDAAPKDAAAGDQPPVASADHKGGGVTGPPAPLEPYHPEKMMRSTRGGRVLARGAGNVDLAVGYPHWAQVRAFVGIANEREAAIDAMLAYRSAMHIHEVQIGSRYRFMGTGPLQMGASVAIGGGGNSGGRNNFTLDTGVAVTLVFGERVALSARLEVGVWSSNLCGTPVKATDATADTPNGCQVDKDDKPVSAEADALTSGGAAERDNGVRLLGGVALEIAFSDTTNLFAAFDRRLLGNEKRAGFTNSFNGFMVLEDDPGWQASAGVSFGF